MKKINILLAAACMLLASTSCEGLLDVKNPSGIYGSDYWANMDQVKSYLTGTYTRFRSTWNSLEYFEARGDEFIAGLEGSGSNQWAHNLTSTNGLGWGSYYTTIQHCNMIIRNIDKVNFPNKNDRDQILAEAYAMRASMYFSLVRLWGDCPLELVPTEGSAKEKLPRSPKTDVMKQILEDCDTAIGLFPTDGWAKGKARASKRGVYAMKADALLWKAKVLEGTTQDLQDVITYADLAAEGSSLEEDFSQIYSTSNRNGKEVIWCIYYGYPETSGDSYTHFMTLRDVFVEKAVNKDLIPYAKSGARSSYAPSTAFRNIFNRYPGDVRKNNAFIDAVDASGNVLGTSQLKMPGTKTETNVIFDTDQILYRHAEMIMFKAEAQAALGHPDLAIDELNKIRKRAGIGPYSGATDKVSVEREILEERGREFWLENKRWPDLLRFHHEGIIDVYAMVPKLKERADAGIIVPLYFDIPLSDLSLNHKLTHTEGYEEL